MQTLWGIGWQHLFCLVSWIFVSSNLVALVLSLFPSAPFSFFFAYFYLCLSHKRLLLNIWESLAGYSCGEWGAQNWLKDLKDLKQEADLLTYIFHSGLIRQWAGFSLSVKFFLRVFLFLQNTVIQTWYKSLIESFSRGWTSYHLLCIFLLFPWIATWHLISTSAVAWYPRIWRLSCSTLPQSKPAIYCHSRNGCLSTVLWGKKGRRDSRQIWKTFLAVYFSEWPWQRIGLGMSIWHNSSQWGMMGSQLRASGRIYLTL